MCRQSRKRFWERRKALHDFFHVRVLRGWCFLSLTCVFGLELDNERFTFERVLSQVLIAIIVRIVANYGQCISPVTELIRIKIKRE